MSREEQLVSRGVIAEWEEYKEAKSSMSPPREYWRSREEEDKIISNNTCGNQHQKNKILNMEEHQEPRNDYCEGNPKNEKVSGELL